MFSLHGLLSSSQMFSIMFKSGDLRGGGGGGSTTFTLFAFRYAVVPHARMCWNTIVQQLHSSVVSQQWNGLRIEHFLLIASCS